MMVERLKKAREKRKGERMDNRIAATIGKNIMRRTADLGLTTRELANRIGVADTTACCWMNGIREPKAYALYRLARFFGCTMEDLCEGLEEMR